MTDKCDMASKDDLIPALYLLKGQAQSPIHCETAGRAIHEIERLRADYETAIESGADELAESQRLRVVLEQLRTKLGAQRGPLRSELIADIEAALDIERSTTLKHCPSSGRIRELVEHIDSIGAHTQAAEVESMGAEIERLKLTLQQQHARAVREMERADRLRAALERARNYVWRNQGGNGCAETLKIADEALGTISQVETPVARSKSQQKRFDATRRAHETSQRHLTASEDAAMQRALERSVTVIHPGIPPEETTRGCPKHGRLECGDCEWPPVNGRADHD